MGPEIHIAIMHDRRRAERLPRLLSWLGSNVEAVRSGLDGSITIGDGTRRGAWTAMKWCICDFLASGKPWMLLLEDDAEPTEGGTEGSLTAEIAENAEKRESVSGLGPDSVTSAVKSYWPIREACAELVEWIQSRWWWKKSWSIHGGTMTGWLQEIDDIFGGKHSTPPIVVHLCCTGGDAAEKMDRAEWTKIVPLCGAPVGTVAVLMSRRAAMRISGHWMHWHRERDFEKKYSESPDAGDARLWEMEREDKKLLRRFITVRSLVEHGCAGEAESLVREGWEKNPPPGEAPPSPQRGEGGEGMRRRMHNPIAGVTPLEWVRSFAGANDKAESVKREA